MDPEKQERITIVIFIVAGLLSLFLFWVMIWDKL